jgi:hypothetical protein
MSITLVSALILPRHGQAKHRVADYLRRFEVLADSGLPIALFLDPALRAIGEQWCIRFPKVQVLAHIELADTAVYRATEGRELRLPEHRGANDSCEYMMIGNSKLEWLQRAARIDPFATTHFAWIDFGVAHILSDPAASFAALGAVQPRYPLIAPGCYRRDPYSEAQLWSQVCWHYCGGFLLCDRANAEYLNDEFLHCLDVESPRLAWEVNFWTVMELKYGVQFSWYQAEFDDSMLQVPPALCLERGVRQ